MENKKTLPFWAIIPAAGIGSRMQSQIPKQYLPLLSKSILEHSLSTFMQHPLIKGIILATHKQDLYWSKIHKKISQKTNKPILIAQGGAQRSDSVLSALNCLKQKIQGDAWVFVHDAARPCLLTSDLDKLMQQLQQTEVGVLLGLPISDTLKRCNEKQQVEKTIDRNNIWRALTPQVFKLLTLSKALHLAQAQQVPITDESSAIELMGLKADIICGDSHNIKMTHPSDLALAEQFLTHLAV